jgi:hypothetical protein
MGAFWRRGPRKVRNLHRLDLQGVDRRVLGIASRSHRTSSASYAAITRCVRSRAFSFVRSRPTWVLAVAAVQPVHLSRWRPMQRGRTSSSAAVTIEGTGELVVL